jgi:hypothetical protein
MVSFLKEPEDGEHRVYLSHAEFLQLPEHPILTDESDVAAIPYDCWRTLVFGVWMYIEKHGDHITTRFLLLKN